MSWTIFFNVFWICCVEGTLLAANLNMSSLWEWECSLYLYSADIKILRHTFYSRFLYRSCHAWGRCWLRIPWARSLESPPFRVKRQQSVSALWGEHEWRRKGEDRSRWDYKRRQLERRFMDEPFPFPIRFSESSDGQWREQGDPLLDACTIPVGLDCCSDIVFCFRGGGQRDRGGQSREESKCQRPRPSDKESKYRVRVQ